MQHKNTGKMELRSIVPTYKASIFRQRTQVRKHHHHHHPLMADQVSVKSKLSSSVQQHHTNKSTFETAIPTMDEILAASRAQNLDLKLQTAGPFYKITARNAGTEAELGRAEGVTRVWLNGKILHLDSMKLNRETLGMERSIFGIGLFIGAVAIRYGYDRGCQKAELLAVNDTDLYHSKLVRFYTRLGFKPVYEVTGSTFGDYSHMLTWGGIGTLMDADIEELMTKWCARFKNRV